MSPPRNRGLSRNGGHGSIEEDEYVKMRGGQLADTDFDFEGASAKRVKKSENADLGPIVTFPHRQRGHFGVHFGTPSLKISVHFSLRAVGEGVICWPIGNRH